jgi:hypothetical protein
MEVVIKYGRFGKSTYSLERRCGSTLPHFDQEPELAVMLQESFHVFFCKAERLLNV